MRELSLHLLDIAENSARSGARRVYITVCEKPSADRLTFTICDDGYGMDAATLARVRTAALPPRVGGTELPPRVGGDIDTPPHEDGTELPPCDGGDIATPPREDGAEPPPCDGGDIDTPPRGDGTELPPRDGGGIGTPLCEAGHTEALPHEVTATPTPYAPRVLRGGRGIPLLRRAAQKTGGGVTIVSSPGFGTVVTAEFGYSHPVGIPLGDAAASIVTLAQGSPEIDFAFTYQFEAEKFSVSTREQISALSDRIGIPGDGNFAAYSALLEFIREGIQKTKGRRYLNMKNMEELCALRDKMKPTMGIRADDSGNTRVIVGMATCGIEAGARPVLLSFVEECAKNKLTGITVAQTGCLGICAQEPVVEVVEPGKEKVTYVKMTAEKAAQVVEKHLIGGKVITEYTIGATNK